MPNDKPDKDLYEFHFQHLAILNELKLNFSDADKVSMVIGAIKDNTIKSGVAANPRKGHTEKVYFEKNYISNKSNGKPENTEI